VRVGPNGAREPIRTLSAAGRYAESPRVAVHPQGAATAVWARSDGSHLRIQTTHIAAHGVPAQVQTLSAAGGGAFDSDVGVDSEGRATVVWARFDGVLTRIQSVRVEANGVPGIPRTLSPPGAPDQGARAPRVAVDAEGRATVVWQRGLSIQAVRLDEDGILGPVRTLYASSQGANHPQVSLDPEGRATVVWGAGDGTVQSMRLGADAAPGPRRTLSKRGELAGMAQVATDPTGRATVVWEAVRRSIRSVQSRRVRANGSLEPLRTLAPDRSDAPQVGVDSLGRATVVWTRRGRIQTRRLRANGSPEPVKTLGPGFADPHVAMDDEDRAHLVWGDLGGRLRSTRGRLVPITRITKGPSGLTRNRRATFAFAADERGSSFECKLDRARPTSCASPMSYSVGPGNHSFQVRATHVNGNRGPIAKRSWRVQR
jgi:hypothetical protein